MKPHRIRMTHNLLLNYGLYRKMEIYVCGIINTFITLLLTSFYVSGANFPSCVSASAQSQRRGDDQVPQR